MKVLVAGNLANTGYEVVYAMRKKNVDAKLLLPKSPIITEDPKLMYPHLEIEGYPEWLVRFDKHERGFRNNWKLQIIKEMRKKEYDVIIALTEFSIFALFSGKPYVSVTTGSDLRELYFKKSLRGLLFRLSFRKAKAIIYGEPDKIPLLTKLGLYKKAVFVNNPRQFNKYSEKVEKGKFEDRFVIFSPTAQDWRLKGNDKLLLAFIKLCSTRNDVYLIVSERGPDVEKAKELLSVENAKGKFQFVPLLDAKGLQQYYNLADVVSDQFMIGSIGMIAVEAMSCGKPVLIKLDEVYFKECYKYTSPGLINVKNETEIFNELNRLVTDINLRQELGRQNKKWIEDNWNYDKLTDQYIATCVNVITNRRKKSTNDKVQI